MNKIRIATNDMALTVKMSDEQANVWFGTLTRALLGEYPDIAEPVEVEEPEAEDSEPETEEQPSDLDEDEPEPVEEPTPQESYKGFLRITCAHCGETGSFNARYPIGFYRCKSCGENNALHDLHRLKFRCECGHTWVYHTNATEHHRAELPCVRYAHAGRAGQKRGLFPVVIRLSCFKLWFERRMSDGSSSQA